MRAPSFQQEALDLAGENKLLAKALVPAKIVEIECDVELSFTSVGYGEKFPPKRELRF
jgi:hypothetical protein